jgi:hypothetical protein
MRFLCRGDDDSGHGISNNALDFCGSQSPIQASENGTNFVASEHELKTFGAVFGEQSHTVAHTDTRRSQGAGCLRTARIQLRKGPSLASKCQSRRIWPLFGKLTKNVGVTLIHVVDQ